MSATRMQGTRRLAAPAFDHVVFPIGLGFVAGFIDVFGFMALFGLLAAHVTGNLVFLAVDIARGQYDVAMKLASLPIFAASVAASAWLIGAITARGRHPFMPVILIQAAVVGLCLVAGLVLPQPLGPDDWTAMVIGSMAIFAMALQNAAMRLIFNNLPPTTVMTGNITHVVSEAVRQASGFTVTLLSDDEATLVRRARRIAYTLSAFTVGALAGGLAQVQLGYPSLLIPIAVLLAMLPFGRSILQAAR
jgi:uncharacterized membrane protein YoaK (UPF0700 family)